MITERERWGVRGPVQSCRLERTWYSRRCGSDACETEERHDTATVEFRADGSVARHSHVNPDGSAWTATFDYDGEGRRRAMRSGDSCGAITSIMRYEYDAAGRVARVIETRADGSERVVESWDYGAAGVKRKTVQVDPALHEAGTQCAWGVEGTDAAYSAPGATAVTTAYNDRDQPIELVFQDAAGAVRSKVVFVYDESGHLLEEEQTNSEEALPDQLLAQMNPSQQDTVRRLFGVGEPNRRSHHYDAAGRRCETRSQIGPLGADTKTTAYNEHGDPVLETHEHEERDYEIDDEGRLSSSPTRETAHRTEARYTYEYDARGNWTRKVAETRGGTDQDFTPSSIELRAITYAGGS